MPPDGLPNRSYQNLVALNKRFDEQLSSLSEGNKSDSPSFFSAKKVFLNIFLAFICLILPFVILVRTSVYLYLQHSFNGWVSLAVGVLATCIVLLLYSLFVSYRMSGNIRINKYVKRGIAILVVSYTLYGLLYYSSLRTKTEEVNAYYRSLHPIIRVTLTTVTLANSDLLVTDIRREPLDYTQMGLPVNDSSLHYVQTDGYVHAVDLRTKDRAEWKNMLDQLLFNIIGLETLRHRGTADHLHVYLPLND